MTAEFVEDDIDFSAYLKETNLTHGLTVRDSEKTIISILIAFPDRLADCAHLSAEHFAWEFTRSLYAEIQKQSKVGYDVITLAAALPKYELTDIHKVSQFCDHSPRTLDRHIGIVIDGHKSRKLYGIADTVRDLAFEQTPIQDRLDKVSSALMELEDKEDFGEWISAHESAIKHLDLLEQRESGVNTGIETGLHDLDSVLDGGFQRGNLVVVGARPAMGKSAIGLSIGLHISQSLSVGFISMEMSRADIADRQAAILGHISISHIKQPKKGLEYDRIVESVEKSKYRKFFVVEQGGLNILQVRAKAKALKRRHGLDVLVVDYIGLMAGLDPKQSRAYQIEEISRGLKTLAKELDIVVICLAQVNRGAADKGNQPPSLHELRDSGAIEQDADVVAFIHRPIQAQPEIGEQFTNYGLLRVAKNRQGRCGDVHLHYAPDQTRFASWAGTVPTKSSNEQPRSRGFNE